MADSKGVSGSSKSNIYDKILIYIIKKGKGNKDISRNDFIRDLRKEFSQFSYSDIEKTIPELTKNGHISIQWVGVGDFNVNITQKGIEYIESNKEKMEQIGASLSLKDVKNEIKGSKKAPNVLEIVEQPTNTGMDNNVKEISYSELDENKTKNSLPDIKDVKNEGYIPSPISDNIKNNMLEREKRLMELENEYKKNKTNLENMEEELNKRNKILDEKESKINEMKIKFNELIENLKNDINEKDRMISTLKNENENIKKMYSNVETVKENEEIKNKQKELLDKEAELNNIKLEISGEKDIMIQHELDLSTTEYELEEKKKLLEKEYEQLAIERNKRNVIIKAIEGREKQLDEMENKIKEKEKSINIAKETIKRILSMWLEKIEKMDVTLHSYMNSAQELKITIEDIYKYMK